VKAILQGQEWPVGNITFLSVASPLVDKMANTVAYPQSTAFQIEEKPEGQTCVEKKTRRKEARATPSQKALVLYQSNQMFIWMF